MKTGQNMAFRRGFTLIELLVVVAIIAILAAIALPSFLEAQTRAKVSAALASLRQVADACETYAVDNGVYPTTRPRFPDDPLGVLAHSQLISLTTPIAYTSVAAFRDPFGTIQVRRVPVQGAVTMSHFPELQPPNPQKSLLFYNYRSLAERFAAPPLSRSGNGIISIGPDLRDSFGVYRPFSAATLEALFPGENLHPISTVYDPTNGTVSSGDIGRFTGAARGFSIP